VSLVVSLLNSDPKRSIVRPETARSSDREIKNPRLCCASRMYVLVITITSINNITRELLLRNGAQESRAKKPRRVPRLLFART